MTFKKAKLFRFKKDQNERITCISYDDNEEYYSFLREYRSKGYRQVIITTEIMIKIIETSVLNDNLFVYKIELAEEDEELEKEIDQLLTKTQHNSSYFALLFFHVHKIIVDLSYLTVKIILVCTDYNVQFFYCHLLYLPFVASAYSAIFCFDNSQSDTGIPSDLSRPYSLGNAFSMLCGYCLGALTPMATS